MAHILLTYTYKDVSMRTHSTKRSGVHMEYMIENGIEDVTKQSQQLAEKPRMLFLGYNADTKTASCTFDLKSATDEIVAFICHPVDADALQAVIKSCYEAAAIERELKPTQRGAALGSEDLKRMFRENGFSEKYYSDLIMAVYLWKTYAARHLSSADGKRARLFMGFDGNCYTKDDTGNNLWFYNTSIREGQPYVGISLPAEFAQCSTYEIGAAMIRAFIAKRDALYVMKEYAQS